MPCEREARIKADEPRAPDLTAISAEFPFNFGALRNQLLNCCTPAKAQQLPGTSFGDLKSIEAHP